jgi:hypothetical protein
VSQTSVIPTQRFSVSQVLQASDARCHVAGFCMLSQQQTDEGERAALHHGYLFFDMQRLPFPERVCFADIRMDKSMGDWPWHIRGCMLLYLSLLRANDDADKQNKVSILSEEQTRDIQSSLGSFAAEQDARDPNLGIRRVFNSYPAYRYA